MNISASIYSSKEKDLKKLVEKLDSLHIDYLHVDCNDDLSVFDDIEEIRKYSKTPIDLHIIAEDVEKYFPLIEKHRIEMVCIQSEPLKHSLSIPEHIPARWGVAIMNDTPVQDFSEIFRNPRLSFGMLMTTTPGKSGGKFSEETYDRIALFNQLFPEKRLQVDGGVTADVAARLRSYNVYSAVSGSYLVGATLFHDSLTRLKGSEGNMKLTIKDIMILPNYLPIVSKDDLSLEKVIQSISSFKMAFCIIVDDKFRLAGIVTDGDLRRLLLENLEDLNQAKQMNGLMNIDPISVNENDRVSNVFSLIHEQNKKIMIMPVVDEDKTLKGAVSLNQLINDIL